MDDHDRPDSNLTRQEFVELVGEVMIVVALGGFLRYLGRDEAFVRPPRARPEEEFLSLCLRCDKCREACPWDLISPVPLSKSIINAGTPVLQGHCRDCWLCIEVCPTGALR